MNDKRLLKVLNSKEGKTMAIFTKFMAHLERMMVAATFAQAGCWDIARGIMDEEKRRANQRPDKRSRITVDQRPVLRM
jgi:hypothetical protein